MVGGGGDVRSGGVFLYVAWQVVAGNIVCESNGGLCLRIVIQKGIVVSGHVVRSTSRR